MHVVTQYNMLLLCCIETQYLILYAPSCGNIYKVKYDCIRLVTFHST